MGRAVIEFDPQAILDFCKPGGKIVTVESKIPLDAKLVGVEYSNTRDIWLLGFESESLPDTPRSQQLPQLDPPEITIHYAENSTN